MRDTIINGEQYLRISDLAKASGVNIRTLQRWVNRGDLVNHLTMYQNKSGMTYFRMGAPHENDHLIEGSSFIYHLPKDAAESN